MLIREDFLEYADSFLSLENYRNMLKKVQSTTDFMFDVSRDLLFHAGNIQLNLIEEEVAGSDD